MDVRLWKKILATFFLFLFCVEGKLLMVTTVQMLRLQFFNLSLHIRKLWACLIRPEMLSTQLIRRLKPLFSSKMSSRTTRSLAQFSYTLSFWSSNRSPLHFSFLTRNAFLFQSHLRLRLQLPSSVAKTYQQFRDRQRLYLLLMRLRPEF